METIVKDLKKMGMTALKVDFEAEDISFQEALHLRDLAYSNGLDFVVKIGGCEAYRDMSDANKLCCDCVVAPMIESVYAFKKFMKASSNFSFKKFINIETFSGRRVLSDILEISEGLEGVVIGRSDLCGSLGESNVDSEQIFALSENIANLVKKYNKKVIIGGCLTVKSIDFLKKLPIDNFETRMIVFDKSTLENNTQFAIQKAIEFEIKWLESKSTVDKNRIKILNERVIKSLQVD